MGDRTVIVIYFPSALPDCPALVDPDPVIVHVVIGQLGDDPAIARLGQKKKHPH